jgi:tetratricopeptide (TPR) repeat protein
VSVILKSRSVIFAAALCLALMLGGCGLFGPKDETAEAAALVQEANQELQKIKELYDENEGDGETPGKREQLKQALEANDAERVRKISDDVVYIIGDGMNYAKSAIEKIQQAQDLNTNDDYKEYLRLKEMALSKQVEAFENYRQAARSLRDNYDPKNEALRAKVKLEFDDRSDKYRELMEKARDYSSQANELRKDAIRRQSQS